MGVGVGGHYLLPHVQFSQMPVPCAPARLNLRPVERLVVEKQAWTGSVSG